MNFLGTFQVSLAQQSIHRFRSANVQGLLVYLALQAKRPFTRDLLATLFWPEEPDRVAKKNLRQSLYELRKLLKDSNDLAEPILLVTRQTVQFNVKSNYVLDVSQFLIALENGELETAVSPPDGFYQGDLLPGFTCNSLQFEEWLRQERERLHGLAIKAMTDLSEWQLQNGRFTEAQATARRHLECERWSETAHRHVITALALVGNRSGALAQFETCRQILMEELGVEPEAATVDLFERINAGENLVSQTISRHNIPAQTSAFFNREEEQAILKERIGQPEYRLTTLVGEGGVGKSRLAQEVGRQLTGRFRDGVWFISLAGVESSEDEATAQERIATAIAQTLRFPLQGQKSPKIQLISFLRERQTLLLIDNFEHLLAGADVVMDILQQSPETAVLATSRQPLNFMAEWVCPVDQMQLPPPPLFYPAPPFFSDKATQSVDLAQYPAVQLFVDRAERANSLPHRRSGGRFALTPENEEDIATLCRLVAGIPLALELAAASLRKRPLPELIRNIQTTIDTLTTQFRDIPPRHRSMRAVFTNSWVLMNAAEQRLFASLSLFRGGFTAAAAAAVTGADETQLESLIEKSLLRKENGRYRMHSLLRQFAAEKSDELDLTKAALNKHSHYFLTFVAKQAAALTGVKPQEPANQIVADLDNVRKGWETACPLEGVETVANSFDTAIAGNAVDLIMACAPALADFYQIRGLYREGERLFAKAAAIFRNSVPTEVGAQLITYQAGLLVRLAKYKPAIELIAEAFPIAKQVKNNWLQSRLHISWGEALWRQGNLDAAENHLNQALQTAQAYHFLPLIGFANFHLGVVQDYRGQREESLTYLEQALAVWQQIGNRRQEGFTLNSIGGVAYKLGQLERARIALEEALTICRSVDALQGQSHALINLSLLGTEMNEFDLAKIHLDQALIIARFTGDQHAEAAIFYNLGWNGYKAGWLTEAHSFADVALKLRQEIGDQRGEAKTFSLLGMLAQKENSLDEALSFYQSGLKLSQLVGDHQTENEILLALNSLSA